MEEIYVIHVTKKCNMKCLYCYEADKDSTYTWDEVKKYIDELVKNRTSDDFIIEFLGGEPMLAWDIIQNAYEYIETEYNNKVNVKSYNITTNGTIFNEHIIRYLKDNKTMNVLISVDGDSWANQLRLMKSSNENSYQIVKKNIERLVKEELDPGVHIVTHPYNVAIMENSVRHLYGLGIRHIGVGTIESTMRIDMNYVEEFIKQMKNISLAIVNEELPGLTIDLFDALKPKEDVRTYIRDESGKVVGESYGRSGGDITSRNDLYNVVKNEEKDEIADMIFYIRQTAFLNHKRNVENKIFKEGEKWYGPVG